MAHDDTGPAFVTGKAALIEAIKEMQRQFESGELSCAALRVCHADGTWEDIVLGGDDDDERAQALAALREMYARAN